MARQLDTPLRRNGIARWLFRDGERGVSSGTVALVMAVVGVLLAFKLSDFSLQLMSTFFAFAILAYSVDILWGENRIVSFGHGAFFTAGAYVGGLILLGHSYNIVGGHTNFLLGGSGKPPIDRVLSALHAPSVAGVPFLALLIAPLVTGAAGLLIGVIVFRVASPEVYVPLVTLGVGVIAGLEFNDIKAVGASNGLGGVPGYTFTFDNGNHSIAQYGFSAAFLALVIAGYAAFRRSRWGLIWKSSGDDPVRLEAFGYKVRLIRALGFGASTALAGLAGALYISSSHYVGPQTTSVVFSAEILIWVAVGGVGTLFGPLLGALAVNWGEQYLSSNLGFTDAWPLLLGLILIAVVLFLPQGLAGIGDQIGTLRTRLDQSGAFGLLKSGRSSERSG